MTQPFNPNIPPFIRDISLTCRKAAQCCVDATLSKSPASDQMWDELLTSFYDELKRHYHFIHRHPLDCPTCSDAHMRTLEWMREKGHFQWL